MSTKKIHNDQLIKGSLTVDVDLKLTSAGGSKALATDGSGNVVESAVTDAELARLSGVTSDIQDQLDAKIESSEKGANNGVATLDAGGKIPAAQLPNSVMEYQGNWDADTNTPTLADGTGNAGDVYRVNVAGTQDLGSGSQVFAIGDWAVYNGTIWEKSLNSDSVVSVNGQTGVVSLDSDDISEGSTNLYHTDERAQDAIGTILVDTASVDLTYNDGTPSITATVLPAGVDHNSLQNFVANKHIDHSAVVLSGASNGGIASTIGDITASRAISVDVSNATAETSADNADLILIHDNSAGALRKMTRANFLAGIPVSSAGDIAETSFAAANNVSSPANITGLAFANGTVRAFQCLLSVSIDAASDLFEQFTIEGIQRGSDWQISVESVGDNSGITLSITTAGQIQYLSTNLTGFVSNTIKFRASVLGV